MSRKRRQQLSKQENKPVKAKEIVIEQNTPVDPPQSFKRPVSDYGAVRKVIEETFDTVVEVPVITTPREVILFKVKALSRDIESLEPHSKPWCEMLEEIGDLKRKLDKLK